jgi:hypothetical protein
MAAAGTEGTSAGQKKSVLVVEAPDDIEPWVEEAFGSPFFPQEMVADEDEGD